MANQDKPVLSDQDLTLKDLQKHMSDMCVYFGWQDGDVFKKFLLLSEELGELAKEIRRTENLYDQDNEDRSDNKKELSHELIDVFGYLLDIANHYDIDLDQAYREKTEKNLQRKWSREG